MMGEFLKKPKTEQRFFHFFPTGFLYMNMQSTKKEHAMLRGQKILLKQKLG